LIVNKKVNVKREYYRNIRAMCNNLFKNNTFYINTDDENNSNVQLEGMLNFVYWVKHHYYKRNIQDRNIKTDAIKKLYAKYLFYKHFINIDKPIILTEGKSDIVYLKCALKKLNDHYTDLIEFIDDKYCLKINFFRTKKLFRDVFSIGEGAPGLLSLMCYYKKEVDTYNPLISHMPIIIIVDNDDGAKGIKNLLGLKDEIPYYKFFYKQMYILFVDKKNNTKIEDLFDEDLCNMEFGGKKFKADKLDRENDKYFGKHIFSQRIILPNYKTINFERFRPIFNNILEIMSKCRD
jgi:hypothetical protein